MDPRHSLYPLPPEIEKAVSDAIDPLTDLPDFEARFGSLRAVFEGKAREIMASKGSASLREMASSVRRALAQMTRQEASPGYDESRAEMLGRSLVRRRRKHPGGEPSPLFENVVRALEDQG